MKQNILIALQLKWWTCIYKLSSIYYNIDMWLVTGLIWKILLSLKGFTLSLKDLTLKNWLSTLYADYWIPHIYYLKEFIKSSLEFLKDFNYSTDFIHGHLNTIRELMSSLDFSTENSFMAFCLFEIISWLFYLHCADFFGQMYVYMGEFNQYGLPDLGENYSHLFSDNPGSNQGSPVNSPVNSPGSPGSIGSSGSSGSIESKTCLETVHEVIQSRGSEKMPHKRTIFEEMSNGQSVSSVLQDLQHKYRPDPEKHDLLSKLANQAQEFVVEGKKGDIPRSITDSYWQSEDFKLTNDEYKELKRLTVESKDNKVNNTNLFRMLPNGKISAQFSNKELHVNQFLLKWLNERMNM
uniref:hypothetical protein n=1 Tax=Stachybotrys chartarum TaxID=74722 RepID=UPI001EDF054D|nr:hypothetical protein MFW25_mgp10 [Stachybotrys chartarum]UIX25694.1 hypothetical protein [Stachybotrys chartarum]